MASTVTVFIHHFDTDILEKLHLKTQKKIEELLNPNFKHIIEYFHIIAIPTILHKAIMHFLNKKVHVSGCEL